MPKFVKVSVIGPGHQCDGLPNQDATGHFNDGNYWAIIVCDGMGSRIHAETGSHTAVESIKTVLMNADFESSSKEIIGAFYQHWLNKLKNYSIKPNDAATTVLVAWGNNDGVFRYFQLGDGIISMRHKVITPISSDQFSNLTTGLGISKKYSDWNVGKEELSPIDNTLLLMSDGISEDILDHNAFTDALAIFSKNKSSRRIKKHLKKLFVEWPTPFHVDDKSLAMVIFNDKK
jgi:serine/threonine protein phosphatase PrpC